MSGLGKLVSIAAGNTSISEYKSSMMFITWADNTLLHCDMYAYCWSFSSKG